MINPRFSLLLFVLVFLFPFLLFAQNATLTGRVTINMKEGLIRANLKLTGLPKLDTGFRILLNSGMNMKFITDTAGVVRYNSSYSDDVLKYRVHNGKNYISLPDTLGIAYVGAFPVYADTLNFFDYKGVIAFNGKTMRASEQSKWYPVIYDSKNDREIAAFAYNITIDCEDCKTIYMNGSAAQPGPVARFKSNRPFELLLFTGNYEKQEFSGSDFLNANMPSADAENFNKQIVGIKKFYEKKLGISYPQKITFLQHKAIEPYGPNRSWGFVTFPTIAVAGGQFNNQIDGATGKFNHIIKYSFYAHELGHYYFGSLLSPNSTLRWFFLESTAEYLSVKATAHAYSRDSTISYIKYAGTLLKDKKIIPLSKISRAEEIDERYRYSYGALLLLAFEQRFGEMKTYRFLQTAVKSSGKRTDYTFFKTTAINSGISEKDWIDFEEQVIGVEDAQVLVNKLLSTR